MSRSLTFPCMIILTVSMLVGVPSVCTMVFSVAISRDTMQNGEEVLSGPPW